MKIPKEFSFSTQSVHAGKADLHNARPSRVPIYVSSTSRIGEARSVWRYLMVGTLIAPQCL